jgi:AbrB family looped-hinge helix DNA binding protein
MTSRVSAKGQVVIPAALRRRLGLKKGIRLLVTEGNGTIILKPLLKDPVEDSFGMFKGTPSAIDVLLADRRGERREG